MLSWPYALAKQIDLTQSAPKEVVLYINSFLDPDIRIQFNSRLQWSFGQHVAQESYDFNRKLDLMVVILAVEITKALGFSSVLVRYPPLNGPLSVDNFLIAPELVVIDIIRYHGAEARINQMYFITPLDRLTFGVPNKSLLEGCLDFLGCRSAKDPPSSVANVSVGLEPFMGINLTDSHSRNRTFWVQIRKLTSIFQSDTPFLKLNGGLSLQLDREFIGRTSRTLFSSPEFLMTPNTTNTTGVALRDMMNTYGLEGIYGPLTLSAMESIGWPTRRKLQDLRLRARIS